MPITGSVVEQMNWLDFVTFIAYKKVKIKFKMAKCVSNRCKDLFNKQKQFGFRCTLNFNFFCFFFNCVVPENMVSGWSMEIPRGWGEG